MNTAYDSLYYDNLDDYNADIVAAREAYARDELVRAGLCETGCGRKRDTHNRRRVCWACARERWSS